MSAPVTHLLTNALIRRERRSPYPGKIVVRIGQSVSATDIVVETYEPSEYFLINVSQALKISPQQVKDYLHYKNGDHVSEGDILVGPTGKFKRVLRAPHDGRILMPDTTNGYILFERKPPVTGIQAGLSGKVVEFIGETGVVIETPGILLEGVWGNGKISTGKLLPLFTATHQELTRDLLNQSEPQAILIGGTCQNGDLLAYLVRFKPGGLVLASLHPDLIDLAMTMPYPILLLEGFGRYRLSPALPDLFLSHANDEAVINAEAWDRINGKKPEIIIPTQNTQPAYPLAELDYAPGARVRICSTPLYGYVGTLAKFVGNICLPNGVEAPAAEVSLEDGTILTLPLANLEILVS